MVLVEILLCFIITFSLLLPQRICPSRLMVHRCVPLSIPSSSTTNPHHNCYMHTHSIPFSIMDLYNILCVLCFDLGVPNLNIVISHASVGAATVAEIMQERVAVGTVLHLLLPPGMFYGPLARCEG